MADEPTQAGNDQPESPQGDQPAGEGQQSNSELEELREQLSKKDEELKNTNAYVTRLQQQGPGQQDPPSEDGGDPAPEAPEATDDDGSEEYARYGVNKQQVKAWKEVLGVDQLNKKLADYEKREQERQQRETNDQWERNFASLESKYGETNPDLVPKTPAQKEELLKYMEDNRIYNIDVAFREKHGSRIKSEAKPDTQAAKSDRSDAPEPSDDEAYKAALNKAAGNIEKIAQVEAQFKGNPTP